jgi:hypothetical protein
MLNILKLMLEVFGLRHQKLYPLELAAVSAIGAQLNDDARARLDWQVQKISHTTRMTAGKEVQIRLEKAFSHSVPAEFKFSLSPVEFKFASVKLAGAESGKSVVLTFWIVNGQLFQIMYSADPTKVFATRQLEKAKLSVVSCEVLNDPMRPKYAKLERDVLDPQASAKLEDLLLLGQPVGELKPPIVETVFREYVDQLDFQLPADYLHILRLSDGCKVGSWTILAIQDAREICMEDGNCLMLAEKEGVGCVAVGPKDGGKLFHFDYIGDSMLELDTLLVPSMKIVDGLSQQ